MGEEDNDALKSVSGSSLLGHSVLLYCTDPSTHDLLVESIEKEGITLNIATDAESVKLQVSENTPSLIILEHNPPEIDGIENARVIHANALANDLEIPLVLVASEEHLDQLDGTGVIDWLITPFSSSFVRTKLNAWVLRMACHWKRGGIPEDEEERMKSLNDLCILDTPEEHRFDRIVRVAAGLLDVPMAFISLVDSNRQWFKSCLGVDVKETDRDVSFCGHVVNDRKPLIINDALLDERFAHNPLVVGGLRVRFFVGYPLILDDGNIIGTLCLIDTKPRKFSSKKLALLEDLRDMAICEFLAE